MKRIKSHPLFNIPTSNKEISFSYNGKTLKGKTTDTVVSALCANGIKIFTRSFKYHRPRGFYDYYGYGAETLLTINGKPNILAGSTLLKKDMVLQTQNAWPSPDFDVMSVNRVMIPMLPTGFYYKMFHKPKGVWPLFEKVIRKAAGLGKINLKDNHEKQYCEKKYLFPDVCIIGAGIAGIAAAQSALAAGKKVLLLEKDNQLGGRTVHKANTVQNCSNKELNGKKESQAFQIILKKIIKNPNLECFTQTTAFGIYEDNLVAAKKMNDYSGEDLLKIRANSVVVATGASDRHIAFHNNDMVGIVQASAIERMIALHGVTLGEKAVIFTCHDGGYHTAIALEEAGTKVVAVVDARDKITNSEFVSQVKSKNIKIITNQTIHSASGKKSLAKVFYSGLSGGKKNGSFDCDLAVLALGYKSNMQLLAMGREKPKWDSKRGIFRTMDIAEKVYAAGDVNGYASFATIYEEGKKVGIASAKMQPNPASLRSNSELIYLMPPAIESDGKFQFVDKCMDVTRNEIYKSVQEGYNQTELLKRYTSMGMGPGQGKSSYEAIARVGAIECGVETMEAAPTTVRPPFTPISFSVLAGRSHHLVPVRRTAMHHCHEKKGAKFLIAGQWKRPEYYKSPEEEALQVRNSLGIIDVSTLGKIELSGPDVIKFVEFFMPAKYAKLKTGKSRYSIMVAESGILYDDGTISKMDDENYYISTTTGNQDTIVSQFWLWIDTEGYRVHVKNKSSVLSAVNVTGASSREFLADKIDIDISNEALPYMGCAKAKICGIPCYIFRIGFTGELGYEIHYPSEYGYSLWEELMETGKKFNISPVGIEAQRILRLEKGHLIPGTDTDALTSPYDAGVAFAVREDKPDFIGKYFLNNFKAKDFSKREKLVNYKLKKKAPIPEDGVAVLDNGKIAGRVTSSRFSPTVGHGIGLAWVKTPLAKVGGKFTIRTAKGKDLEAEILAHGIYDPKGERMKN